MTSPVILVRGIIHNLGYSVLAVAFSKIFQLLLFVLMARYLGAHGLGEYTYAFSLVMLLAFLSDLGMSQYAVSQVAGAPERRDWYLANLFSLRLALALLGLTAVFLLASFLSLSPSARGLFCLLGLGNFFLNASLGWRWVFQAEQKLKYEALLLLVFGLVSSLCGIAFLFWKREVLYIGISYLLAGVTLFWLCRRIVLAKFARLPLSFNPKNWKEILWGALPLTFYIFCLHVYFNADTILVSSLSGMAAAGLYGASNRIVQQVKLIPSFLNPALLPAFSRIAGDRKKFNALFKKIFYYLVSLLLPVILLVSLAAEKIVELLYGPEFAPSAFTLRIQIWSALFVILYGFVFTSLVAQKRYKAQAVLAFSGLLINLGLNFWLIPLYSIRGAAFSIFASDLVVLSGAMGFLHFKSSLNLSSLLQRLASPVAAGLAMTGIWLAWSGGNWLLGALFSLTAYLATFFLTGGLPQEDRPRLKEVLFSWRSTGLKEAGSER